MTEPIETKTSQLTCVRSLLICAIAASACGFPKPGDVAECTGPSDCKASSAPFCIGGNCVAACASNQDCAPFAATPFCESQSGSCVACLDSSVCPTNNSVCDSVDHRCRGCTRDDECMEGICAEADGLCVAESRIIFVAGSGASSGSCTRAAPCSLAHGVSQVVAASRDYIKIVNGTLAVSAPLTLNSVYIEGSDTMVTGPAAMFGTAQFANVTFSHMRIQPSSGLVTTVEGSRSLRLFDVQSTGGFGVNGGTLDVDRSTLTGGGGVTCMGGTVTVRRSVFDHSALDATTCQVVVQRNRFSFSGDIPKIGIEGGGLQFENNVIIQSEGIADTMAVNNVAPASTIRFNTFVNTTATPSDGVAVSCGSPLTISSNIFAYASQHPLATQRCEVRCALVDSVAVPAQVVGVGSKSADSSTFFVDKAGGDYHLSATSPARGAAEAGLDVSEDFDGTIRPSPAGSPPDIGAYEVP